MFAISNALQVRSGTMLNGTTAIGQDTSACLYSDIQCMYDDFAYMLHVPIRRLCLYTMCALLVRRCGCGYCDLWFVLRNRVGISRICSR